jgi:dynein heavy chain
MEPFVPIPGKPPRKVVIDRQRKLFASLNIEDLLQDLVRNSSIQINL